MFPRIEEGNDIGRSLGLTTVLVGDPFACNGINPLPAMGSLLAARGSARAPQVRSRSAAMHAATCQRSSRGRKLLRLHSGPSRATTGLPERSSFVDGAVDVPERNSTRKK